MAATMEMSHAEAHTLVQEWQRQLAEAQNALASFDIGTFALERGVDKGMQQKTLLETELRRCETGLSIAQAQEKQVQRNEQLVNAARLEREAAEMEKEAGPIADRIRTLGDELVPLNQQLSYMAHSIDRKREQAEYLRRTYGGTP